MPSEHTLTPSMEQERSLTDYIHHLENVQQRLGAVRAGADMDKSLTSAHFSIAHLGAFVVLRHCFTLCVNVFYGLMVTFRKGVKV